MKNTKATRDAAGMPLLPGGPIDWAQWHADAAWMSRPMKGRKMSPEVCAKFSAAQKARFARQRAALAEAERLKAAERARRPEPYNPLACVTMTDRLLGSLQPGNWYSTRDMRDAAPGVKYGTCKAWAVLWWREGVLKRALNPAWKPPERIGAPQEPKWLYCLTAEGEQRHRVAAALL